MQQAYIIEVLRSPDNTTWYHTLIGKHFFAVWSEGFTGFKIISKAKDPDNPFNGNFIPGCYTAVIKQFDISRIHYMHIDKEKLVTMETDRVTLKDAGDTFQDTTLKSNATMNKTFDITISKEGTTNNWWNVFVGDTMTASLTADGKGYKIISPQIMQGYVIPTEFCTVVTPQYDRVTLKDTGDTFQNITPNDPVNKPAHYTDGNIEVIDFIEDKNLGFHLGNAIKYIARAGKKDPTKTIEDLKKASWYLNRYIKLFSKGNLVEANNPCCAAGTKDCKGFLKIYTEENKDIAIGGAFKVCCTVCGKEPINVLKQ